MLAPGARCVARSCARADAAFRQRSGWSDYTSNRDYERAYLITASRLQELDAQLGELAPRVWRRVSVLGRLRTALRPLSKPLVLLAALICGYVSEFAPVAFLAGVVLSGALRPPFFVTDHQLHGAALALQLRSIRALIRRHSLTLPASAYLDPLLKPLALQALEGLSDPAAEVAHGMLPNFPGTLGELRQISSSLTAQPQGLPANAKP
jgi:hypothetical protein